MFLSVCLSVCLPPGWSDDVCLSVSKQDNSLGCGDRQLKNGGKTHTWGGFKKGIEKQSIEVRRGELRRNYRG